MLLARLLLASSLVACGCGPRLERGPTRDVDIPYDRPDFEDVGFIDAANRLLARAEWAAARELASAKLAREPEHVDARVVLATLAWVAGDIDGSNQLLREALTIDPSDYNAIATLARNLQAQGHYAESLELLEPLTRAHADDLHLGVLQLAAHYALLNTERGLKVAQAMFASRALEGNLYEVPARGRAGFLASFAGAEPLVEISGVRAEVELELHPSTSGMRCFAMIGGERRPVLLSLYHGESWIDTELAASLGLAPLGSTPLAGREPLDVTLVPELELDGLRIARVPALIEDLDSYGLGDPAHDVDLVLGLHVLQRFGAITADHPRHTLSLELAAPIGPPSGAVERPLLVLDTWYYRAPVTPIAIDGSRQDFWAWFGYVGPGALTIEQGTYTAAGHELAELGEIDDPETGREMVLIDEVAFGGLRISGVGGIVHLDEPGEPNLKAAESVTSFPIGGSINAGLLEQLRITWVPSRAVIWVERPDDSRWLPELI